MSKIGNNELATKRQKLYSLGDYCLILGSKFIALIEITVIREESGC